MTEEQFYALIHQLEDFARRQPANYKLRLALLAVLGYAYIFLVLLVVVGIIAFLAAFAIAALVYGHVGGFIMAKFIKLLAIPLVVLLTTVRSLFVHFPVPTGLELTRQQVPRLFSLIDELANALQTPNFHSVILISDFNACVIQRPRLGIFGWQQNYLLLGLPLMQALSTQQFRAVIAHELGHLSGNHTRFAAWIYRVRKTWIQLLQRLQESGDISSYFIFAAFFKWYAPFFNAYSFVLARMNEYEADRCALDLAGKVNCTEALIDVAIKSRFLENDYWQNIYKQVDSLIEPPKEVFTNISSCLHTGVPAEKATQWLEEALAEKTNYADTHPCLSDRLSALGYKVPENQLLLPAPFKTSAAEAFLGNALNQLTAYFDRTWSEQVATPWRQRFAYAQESQRQLESLDGKAQDQALTLEEACTRANLTAEFIGVEAAIPIFQDILATQPEHVKANYALGQILIQQHDATAIDYLEKAMVKDPDCVIPGCNLIYYFLKQRGEIAKAKAYQERAQQHYNLLVRAKQERSQVSIKDKFNPHNLSEAAVQQLGEDLSRYQQVKEAYLVQKVVDLFPENPFYVLAVKRKFKFFEWDRVREDKKLIQLLVNEIKLPGSAYITILNDETKNLGKKLGKIKTSVIYKRR